MVKEIKIDKLYSGFEKKPIIEVKIDNQNVFGKDLYAILGVSRNAEKKEIETAYKKSGLKWHPDRPAGRTPEGKAKLEEIRLAYDILNTYRNNYDNELRNGTLCLDKINNPQFRGRLIEELNKKGHLATFDQINSYASRFCAISGNLLSIEQIIKSNGVYEMKLSSLVERFADPESADQVEQVYNKIVQEIHKRADAKGTSNPNDQLKRKKVEEMKKFNNFSLLTETGEDKEYEEKILNACAEKGQ
ncbi:11526_t:CDS:2 [Ambispora leptoticha]|uniref:11526_t:CDS:1 n=1 Tax=Ambispora leptoticha TaxID=144679 RepID=A0A9N8V7S3_9GLOM|nr:11526_t:CDS:2 [Ambispora leptoticha]